MTTFTPDSLDELRYRRGPGAGDLVEIPLDCDRTRLAWVLDVQGDRVWVRWASRRFRRPREFDIAAIIKVIE